MTVFGVAELILRIALAMIFLIAAFAKLADLAGTRAGIEDFGISSRAARIGALTLPAAEVCIAALLSIEPRVGAIGAALILAIFSCALAVSLVQGKTPACNCFGSLAAKPVSWRTLVRNGVLMILSGILFELAGSRNSVTSGFALLASLRWTTYFVAFLTAASIAQGWLIFLLLRQQGRLLLSIDSLSARLIHVGVPQLDSLAGVKLNRTELAVGAEAPAFALGSISGEIVSLTELISHGVPTVLIFSHPRCRSCTSLVPAVRSWCERFRDALNIVVISSGTEGQNRDKGLIAPITVLLQQESEISEVFGILETPSALRIDHSGRIASRIARGNKEIEALVLESLGDQWRLPEPYDRSSSELLYGPAAQYRLTS